MDGIRGWKQRLGIRDKASGMLAGFSLAVIALHFAFIVSYLVPRAGALRFLRLHYSVVFGVDWVAEWRYLFIFPAIGAAAFIVNGLIAGVVAAKKPSFALALHYATALIETALAAAGAIAVLLNS